jgi:hypothetical protein
VKEFLKNKIIFKKQVLIFLLVWYHRYTLPNSDCDLQTDFIGNRSRLLGRSVDSCNVHSVSVPLGKVIWDGDSGTTDGCYIFKNLLTCKCPEGSRLVKYFSQPFFKYIGN